MKVYENKGCVLYSDCDFNAQMSITRILEIAENACSELTSLMGCDNMTLHNQYDAFWVFAKIKIKSVHPLAWGENYTVSCKIDKSNILSVYFLTTLSDEEGNPIVKVITEACILDKATMKMQKLKQYGIERLEISERIKIRMKNIETKPCFSTFVGASMVDYSMHLNNTKTLAMYVDTLSTTEYNALFQGSYECVIFYKAQAMLKEQLFIETGKQDEVSAFCVKKEDDTVVVQCEIEKK